MTGYAAVTYTQGAPIDTAQPLWVDQQLFWAEWFEIEIHYPELGKPPIEAAFRQASSVLIMPPSTGSARHIELLMDPQIDAGNVHERYWQVHPKDGKLLWVLLHVQPAGVPYASLHIYRRA